MLGNIHGTKSINNFMTLNDTIACIEFVPVFVSCVITRDDC